jgi:DNA-binding SARP family transcriptional activator/Flp pilus assembly protein TadD
LPILRLSSFVVRLLYFVQDKSNAIGDQVLSRLSLYLLGSPRIERDVTPIEVDTRKAVALIAYLAMTGEDHSRDALATLLWPEYDQTRARAALRRTLSALRKALDGEWLEADRESIGLNREADLWLDVQQFHDRLAECRSHNHPVNDVCAACLVPLQEAANLYRDDFLSGFTLRDSTNFDDWQFFETESLRRELAGALERLVHGHVLQGEFEAAIPLARRWLALDPLQEAAHRGLMQLYAWTGQRGAALRQYRECVRILEQELGVPPLEETTELYKTIEADRVLPAPEAQKSRGTVEQGSKGDSFQAPTWRGTGTAYEYPLVGRSRESARLLETYAALGTEGRFVAIEGEAGIGKTRLAEEFLAQVEAQGGPTISARCYEGETTLAYGPFVEGLRGAINRPGCTAWLEEMPELWVSEAARLLPELASLRPGLPSPPPLDRLGAQSLFFQAISELLATICGVRAQPEGGIVGPPGSRHNLASVLFIDDLHWADSASVDLLTYLVRRLGGRALCILVTWRAEQVPPTHRLRHLLSEAQRVGRATIVSLPRLSPSEVSEFVQSAVATGIDVPEELGERLYRETEGLPFFLVEYLATMIKDGTLGTDGEWSMPTGVRDLLHSRLKEVSQAGWQLLTTAAVIGRSFDFDALRFASGRSEEEAVTGLEGLMSQGLIQELRSGSDAQPTGAIGEPRYDFGHEKLRTLVYEETSLARRLLLHRRVAEALVVRERDSSLAGQIAHHYRLARQDSQAAEYYRLAGEHARSLYANAEALDHFRSALALGHPDAAELHEAIGDLQTLQGEYSGALTSYETAAALCEPDVLADLEHKLGTVHHRRGEWELAESHFQAAQAALGETDRPGQNARLYADWSLTAHQGRRTEQAVGLAHQALELAEAVGDTRALAQAHNILGILATNQGQLEKATHHLGQSLTLAETLDDPGARVAALNNLALARSASEDFERAIELTKTALGLCTKVGDRHRQAALHNNLADLYHATGQPEAAMSYLKRAVGIFAEIGEETGDWQPEIWKLMEW